MVPLALPHLYAHTSHTLPYALPLYMPLCRAPVVMHQRPYTPVHAHAPPVAIGAPPTPFRSALLASLLFSLQHIR
ncbi:hypothetical protein E2C01_049845 [Portunus trituberculatus]|uniref:Uncharacterized protein n=1 Tax=Portunus trituberculatus TaxID=210409 RepID=A0A5B7GEC1_PORTR|nr:hypothetical protein [Portunus trituberculatus]